MADGTDGGDEAPPKRSNNGRFPKGNQAAKGKGRPRKRPEMVAAFREMTDEAKNTLAGIMRNKRNKAADRLKAADRILDRAWGNTTQKTEMSGPDGAAIPVANEKPMLTSAERRARHAELMEKARKRQEDTKGQAPAASDAPSSNSPQ